MTAGAVLCGGASRRMGTDKASSRSAAWRWPSGSPRARRRPAAPRSCSSAATPCCWPGSGGRVHDDGGRARVPAAACSPRSTRARRRRRRRGVRPAAAAARDRPPAPRRGGRARRTPTSSWPPTDRLATRPRAVAPRGPPDRRAAVGRRGARRCTALIAALRSVTVAVDRRDAAQRQHDRRTCRPPRHRLGTLAPWPCPRSTSTSSPSAWREGARVIDVREPDEYTAGHVPGGDLDPAGDRARAPRRLPRRRPDVRDLPLGRPQPAGVRVRRRPGPRRGGDGQRRGRHRARGSPRGATAVLGDQPS